MYKEILVIDDNPDIRSLVSSILKEKNYEVRAAANYDQAVFEIKKKLPDLAIIDIKLDKPDKDGIDLLKLVTQIDKLTPVIMISGHATVSIAVEATRLGAYEFIEKPFSKEKILNYVNRALERANKGTLLIDEVSEIPYSTQANVLRVLIDQKFKRLNGSKDINVNIRLISSTSKDLYNLVKEKKFREDLYHRLNVMPIELTSLSLRTEDIPLLIDYFKEKLSEINGVQQPKIDIKNDNLYTYNWPGNVRELRNLVERITILSADETKSDINKLIEDILNPSSSVSKRDLLEKSFESPLKEARKNFEKEYLIEQLKKNHGNVSKTADFIGMERSALHRKLKELGIKGIN